MLLSEQPEYLAAIPAAAAGDFTAARAELLSLISKARREQDLEALGFLLQVLGDVEARDGNAASGHALHQEAIRLAPESPLPRLIYAKGLFTAFHLPVEAEARLAESEAIYRSRSDWDAGEPTEWYEEQFLVLRKQLNASL